MKCSWCNGMGFYELTCTDCSDDEWCDEFCMTCRNSRFVRHTCEDCNGTGEIDDPIDHINFGKFD